MGPVATATTKSSAMTHHARMRALMFSTVARPGPLVMRRLRIHPTIEATTSSESTPPASPSESAASSASVMMSLSGRSARPRFGKKLVLRFVAC